MLLTESNNISHFWKVLKAKTIFSAHITVRVGVTHTHGSEWRQQRGQDSKINRIRGRPWSPTTGEIALEMMYSLHGIIRKCWKQFQELSGSSRHVIFFFLHVNTSGLKQHTRPWRADPSGHNSHNQTQSCALQRCFVLETQHLITQCSIAVTVDSYPSTHLFFTCTNGGLHACLHKRKCSFSSL